MTTLCTPTAESSPQSRAAVRAARQRLALRVALLLLVGQFVFVGLWQARRDSPTVDEAVDIATGVTSLDRHDLRLNPEHGPLPKVLAVAPALLAHPVLPHSDAYEHARWFDYTDEFLQQNRAVGRLDDVVFLSRLVPLAIGAGCALLLRRLGRGLFGEWAGFAAAALWLTTPVFVGFAHFAMIDVPFTFTVLLLCEALRSYLDRPSHRSAALLGVAGAAALLTRHLALPIVGVVIAIVVASAWREGRRPAMRAGAIVALIAFAGVWVGVRTIAPRAPGGEARAALQDVVDRAGADSITTRAALTIPFPLEYRAGLGYLTLTSDRRPAYLFGDAWDGSRVWYFPGSLVTKVPIGGLGLLAVAPLGWRTLDAERRRRALAVVLIPGGACFALVLLQPLNLGLRLAFPALALALVCVGPLVEAMVRQRWRVLLVAVALTQLVAFWDATPHSLAWTAPPFRPAYRFVSDSNVDFAQDADRVADWVRAREAAGDQVWVSMILPRGMEGVIGGKPLLNTAPSAIRGWVAVGATSLTEVNRRYLAWLRAYCPTATIGGSVLLYRFDNTPERVDGPTMPASPCWGEASHR